MLTTRQWAESILLADCPYEDLTTVGLGIEETCGTVSASLKAPGIAAGIDLAREIFLAAGASVEVFAKDGDSLAARVSFLCARGSAQALHAAYKTAQCVWHRPCTAKAQRGIPVPTVCTLPQHDGEGKYTGRNKKAAT